MAASAKCQIVSENYQFARDRFVPVTGQLIPVGGLCYVQGTPFDFRSAPRLGDGLATPDGQLQLAGGYDHSRECTSFDRPAALVSEPFTGRRLALYTDQPALHLYTGNYLKPDTWDKAIAGYGRYSGLCLEAQGFASAPNDSEFEDLSLLPGQVYERFIRLMVACV